MAMSSMRRCNVEFSGLRGRPNSTSNASQNNSGYFEKKYTTGFRTGDILSSIDENMPEYTLTEVSGSEEPSDGDRVILSDCDITAD